MEQYGKFYVGQRVRTTCKYECEHNDSFEGEIIEIYANCAKWFSYIVSVIKCNNNEIIKFDISDYGDCLEPVCPKQHKCKFSIGDYVRTTDERDRITQLSKCRGQIINIEIRHVTDKISYNSIEIIDNYKRSHFYRECDLELDDCYKCTKTYINDNSKEIKDLKCEISRLSTEICDLKYDYKSMNRFSNKNDDELSPTEECICFIILFAVLILATYGSLKLVGLI